MNKNVKKTRLRQILVLWELPAHLSGGNAPRQIIAIGTCLCILAMLMVGLVSLFAAGKIETIPLLSGLSAGILGCWWLSFTASTSLLARNSALWLTPQFKPTILWSTALMWVFMVLLAASYFVSPIMFCVVVICLDLPLFTDQQQVKKWTLILGAGWVTVSTFVLLLRPDTQGTFIHFSQFMENVEALILFGAALSTVAAIYFLIGIRWLAGMLIAAVYVVGYFLFKKSLPFSHISALDWATIYNGLHPSGIYIVAQATLLVAYTFFVMASSNSTQRYASRAFATSVYRLSFDVYALRKPNRTEQYANFFQHSVVYSFLLNQALKRGAPTKKLWSFLFRPDAHWSTIFMFIPIMILPTFVIPLITDIPKSDAVGYMLLNVLPINFLFFTLLVHTPIYESRREQALMSLTPKALPPAQQNRWVCVWAIKYAVALAIPIGLVILYMALFSPLFVGGVPKAVFISIVGVLMMPGALVRDYARMPAQASALTTFMTCSLMIIPWIMVATRSETVWEMFAVVSFVVVAFGIYRCYRLARLPHAFPVGRLSAE